MKSSRSSKALTKGNAQALTKQTKRQALKLGADVACIAPVERFVDPPPFDEENIHVYPHTGYEPTELLPGARSVIALGIGQLTGVLESTVNDAKTTYPFGNFGYWFLNHRLDQISFDLSGWLEERGWPSLPLGEFSSSRFSEKAQREPDYKAALHGVFSIKRAAVLAGIGRKSKSTLVANPRYGTQIRLGCVITTAPLKEDPLLEGSPCPPDCRICVEVCPTRSVLPDGRVDHIKCYSDVGRRARTLTEARRLAMEVYPPEKADTEVLQVKSDSYAVNHVGNRLCRVVCMTFCPLGEVKSKNVMARINDWKENGPRLDLE